MDEPCFAKICFCHEWRNLLYLRDKKENRTLFFPYRKGNYQQEANESRIYVKSMNGQNLAEVTGPDFSLNKVHSYNGMDK
nr:PREDICTED: DNA-directed RNA polymerase II subunit RPB9 [Pelecanus crispus]